MPIITEIPIILDSLQFSDEDNPRSPGVHLSDVIRSMGLTSGMIQPTVDTPKGEKVKQTRFALGFIWETFIATRMRDTAIKYSSGRIFRPPEICVDGIYMSPDAFDSDLPGIREFKCTAKSSARDISAEWSWFMQMSGYCYGMGTNLALLQVLFQRGNYSREDEDGPHPKLWRVEFSDVELQETWDSIRRHRDTMETRTPGVVHGG